MNPEKLTVKQLFGKLNVGQFWGMLVVVAGLVASALALGYKASSMATDPKLAEKDAQLTVARLEIDKKTEELKKGAAETGDLGTKERFLALYLRYLIANKKGDYTESRTARNALDEFVRQFVDAKELVIHKGGGRLATITFSDGTSWELPAELHIVEKK